MKQKTLKISGKPNEKQKEFFASRAKYTAYGGARGGGKSWALRRKLVGLCLNYPGIRCLIVRRTLSELKSNHLTPLIKEYGEILSYSESEKTVSFQNGSVIILGYCSSERDILRYQGQEYDIIAIDEATQLSEYQFSIFKASLRGVNDFPKRIYLTCNPGGVGHAWVKRLFIDRDFRLNEEPMDYTLYEDSLYEATDDAVTAESIVEHIINIKTEMMKMNVMDPDDIIVEVSPDIAALILKAKIDLGSNNTDALERGVLGKIAGCKIYVSNNIYIDDNDYHKCMVRTKRAIAFAEQISEVEAYRPEKRFADAVKGLHLYGAKVVYPSELMVLSLKLPE